MLNQQHVLKRKSINDELKNIMHYPLTIVTAAMGYGKSTAARDFLNSLDIKYAYLSIESEETSPQYIWDSLTRQLAKTNPEIGGKLRTLGFPNDYSQVEKFLKIIEDYTYNKSFVLVIDDYHLCQSNEFDKMMERIIREDIEGLHILVLTRIIPEMGIEELCLKGYCYHIKSDLFEVSSGEIMDYFMLYGLEISDDIAKQIYVISEGWISAIYLIMQRYGEINRVETGRNLEKLIETAVMCRYSDVEVMILKSLCVLDSISPQQAVYVTGNAEAEWIVKKLSYENSFIRFDEQGCVYRIHNIFNNYLKNLLLQYPLEVTVEELYKRAGEWCIQNGDILSGLNYLLKAKEYGMILNEFEKKNLTRIVDSNTQYILDLFEHIPNEIKYNYPMGYLAYIGFYVTNVNSVEGTNLLHDFEQRYQNIQEVSPNDKKRIMGEAELIRAYTSFNDLTLMHNSLRKAHEMLQGHSSIANKDKIFTFGSPHVLFMYYRDLGKFRLTMEDLEAYVPHYTEMASGCGMGFEYLIRAEYCNETGNLDEAERYAYKAIYKANTMEQVSVIICAKFVLARVSAAKGEFEEAFEIMDDLNSEVETCNSPILTSAFDLCSGYIASITGEKAYFAKWLSIGDIGFSDILYQGMGFNYIIYGRYLLHELNYLRLEVLCEEMMHIFHKFNNQLGYLHMHIMDAIAKYYLYGIEAAKKSILSALEIGRADNIFLSFAEYGKYLLPILYKFHMNDSKDIYFEQLLKYTSNYCKHLDDKETCVKTLPILTSREKDVLQLIVAGKINRDIASELYIAEVTVRKNITSIYRKMNVNGRASAVKKALELNLLDKV